MVAQHEIPRCGRLMADLQTHLCGDTRSHTACSTLGASALIFIFIAYFFRCRIKHGISQATDHLSCAHLCLTNLINKLESHEF